RRRHTRFKCDWSSDVCSSDLFACSDASAKYLNGHMDTIQVVWARYMSAFVLALFMFNPIRRPQVMHTGRPWLQLGRSTLLLVSTDRKSVVEAMLAGCRGWLDL